jgi:hypothetical protein
MAAAIIIIIIIIIMPVRTLVIGYALNKIKGGEQLNYYTHNL